MPLQRYSLGIDDVPDDDGEYVLFSDLPKPGRLQVKGYFASTGLTANVQATLNRALAEPAIIGLHLETCWKAFEPTRCRRDFSLIRHCLDALRPAGKFLWWDPIIKTFGKDLGVCPDPFVSFQHKGPTAQAPTVAPAWMAPIHSDPACLDALCDTLLIAKAEFDGDPGFAYIGTSETAPGNLMPKASLPALTAAWLRIIDTIGAYKTVQPMLCMNFSTDLALLKTRAELLAVGLYAPDAIDTDATKVVWSPFGVSVSMATLTRVGLEAAEVWWRSKGAVAVQLEDFLPAPNDWASLVAFAAAHPIQ